MVARNGSSGDTVYLVECLLCAVEGTPRGRGWVGGSVGGSVLAVTHGEKLKNACLPHSQHDTTLKAFDPHTVRTVDSKTSLCLHASR